MGYEVAPRHSGDLSPPRKLTISRNASLLHKRPMTVPPIRSKRTDPEQNPSHDPQFVRAELRERLAVP